MKKIRFLIAALLVVMTLVTSVGAVSSSPPYSYEYLWDIVGSTYVRYTSYEDDDYLTEVTVELYDVIELFIKKGGDWSQIVQPFRDAFVEAGYEESVRYDEDFNNQETYIYSLTDGEDLIMFQIYSEGRCQEMMNESGLVYILHARAVGKGKKTLDAPVLTVTNDPETGKNVLSWTDVEGAELYEVWGSETKDGTYEEMAVIDGTEIYHNSLAAGKTWYYKVRGVASNAEGEFSNIVGRTCDLPQPVAAATNAAATGKIVLTWNAVEDADKYEVWRSTSKNGTYTKVLTTTGLKMTHSSAKGGETFYYKVKAICDANASGNSAFSAAVGRTCDLAQPKLTVTNDESNGKIVLTWKAVSGADRYEIWRSTTKDGTYTKLTTTTGLKITNSSINAGETYYYKIRAICDDNASGNSAFSAAVGRTCDCAQVVVTITKNSKGKPVITWKAVSGAVKYEVWRSTSENGTYTRLVTTTGLKITNSSAEDGVTYYYKVRAICKVSAGNGAYSAVQAVTVG